MKLLLALNEYIKERFPLEKLSFQHMVMHKEVPLHKMSWAYYLGGVALLLFIIQVATGLLLLFYYQPTVTEAFDSVKFITEKVPGGAVIRNIHAWASSVMILVVIFHLLTTFAMKAFEKPREITWLTGIFLVFITFIFGFSGYLLPWHQLSVNATKVGLEFVGALSPYLPGSLSELPGKLLEIIQGGPTVGQATLSRFFTIHVVVLPFFILFILGVHLLAVQLHGMSKGIDGEVKKYEPFFLDFLIKDFRLWVITFLIIFILAITVPFESFFAYPLVSPYNPLGSTPDGIKPEWYFFFVYYPLELLPFWIIILMVSALVAVLFMVPKLFQGTSRKTLTFLAIAGFIYFVISTVWGDAIFHLIKGQH